MNTDYDPRLEALFARAEQPFDRDAFARDVMARINRERRRIVALWVTIGILAIACLALLAGPLTSAVGLASSLLPAELVELETAWLQQLLSPLNSIAAAVAVGALLLRRFYRWVFTR